MKSASFALIALLAFPSILLADPKAVADARKNVSEAQAEVTKAQNALDKAKDAVKAELAKTPEFADANKALTKSKADQEAATKPVLDKVHASAEYVAAKKAFEDADAKAKALQLEIRNGGSKANSDQLAAAATARGTAKTKMDQLENDALASDPGVQKARKEGADALKKIDEMNNTKLPAMVEADKPCQDAKKALDEAQTKLKTAKDALDAAIKQNKEESKNKKGGGGGKGGGAGGGRAGY